jgi:hypothetical protein
VPFRRWIPFALIAVIGAAWLLAPKSSSHAGRGLPCATHDDCGSALRCFVADAGFCVETCVGDEQCEAAFRCTITAEGYDHLVPVAVGLSPGERVCLRGER